MASRLIAATQVHPVASAPIREGAVVVDDDRIVAVGSFERLSRQFSDLPAQHLDGVLVPGLVNAHTHLQYTGFKAMGVSQFTSFEQWSDAFGEILDHQPEAQHWHAQAVEGAREALATGSTCLAEIVTDDEARGALAEVGIGGVELIEAIGEWSDKWFHHGGREAYIARIDAPSEVPVGLSPHAPYSLDPDVITDMCAIARERGMVVHVHVGESFMENDLYQRGVPDVFTVEAETQQKFRLVRDGGWGMDVGDYVDRIGLLSPTSYLAHVIYLDDRERALIKKRGARVVLCPRSNRVIGLGEARVADFLREGHPIAVGTDSLASSPSLDLMGDVNLLHELAVRQGYDAPDLSFQLLRAATVNGAEALGLQFHGVGTIAPGARADLALFDCTDLDEWARDGAGRCSWVMAKGRVAKG